MLPFQLGSWAWSGAWRMGTRPGSSLRDNRSCSGLPRRGKDLQSTKGSSGRKLERGAGILALGQEAWFLSQGPSPQEATVLASKNRQQSKSLALGPSCQVRGGDVKGQGMARGDYTAVLRYRRLSWATQLGPFQD